MATQPATPSVRPGEVNSEVAQRALDRIKSYLRRHPDGPDEIRLAVELGDDGPLVLPRPAVQMLAELLAHMAAGRGVSVIPVDAQLTTQQAADMLNVSRPYLIKLLETGAIPYRTTGRHRRIRFEDLMAYRRHDDAKRRKAMDELGTLGHELGT